MGDEPAQEREVRRQPLDLGLGERVAQAEQRLVARRRRARSASRSSGRRRRRPRRPPRRRRRRGCPSAGGGARSGPPAGGRSSDPPRRAAPRRRGLRTLVTVCCERLAGGDPELLADDVDAGDELGHRVLDLDAAVQLEEVEVAPVEHELDGAGAAVADRAAERDRGLAHPRSKLAVERGGGRLLEHLLVAALDRALALAEGDDLAVLVGEQLDLDVARALDEALVVDACRRRKRPSPRAGRLPRLPRARPGRGRHACRGRRRPLPP